MSPNVLRERGYRVVIYFNDHPPPHVHVIKDDADARVTLDPVEITNNHGFKKNQLKVILNIVRIESCILVAAMGRYAPA